MKTLFLIFGALSFGLLVFLVGFWYGQPLLSRQFVLRRLNQTKIKKTVSVKQSHELDRLTDLSELLDSTARQLRLGKSLASALQTAAETNCVTDKVIGDLVMATSNGEAFGDAIKRLLDISVPSDLAFTLRTLELAATGGVGGVLALERAAIVLRERSVNIHDRKTQAAQAMLSTQVLSWAPVVVAGWLIVTSTAVRNFLLLSLAGWFCILLGVGFNYAGRKWMQTIVSPKPQ